MGYTHSELDKLFVDELYSLGQIVEGISDYEVYKRKKDKRDQDLKNKRLGKRHR